jgi:signal transduction histidine kinase/CheY-like chemotaxis protein
MADAYEHGGTTWALAIRQRRRALTQRAFLGMASAVIFSPVLGWSITIGWGVAYFLIQLLDLAVFEPVTSGRTERMSPARTALGCAVLFINAAAFGSLAVPMWLIGGPMGGICSAVLLASGAIYAVVNSPQSRLVLGWTLSAQGIYLAGLPVMMAVWGADPALITATAVALAVFTGYCINTWARMNRARDAENRARVDADRRREEAERVLAGRNAFLAAVGHDLRTPISAILTGAAELERGAHDATSRTGAALIGEAGIMMKHLLDDLLDHAKLEAGRMSIEEEDFNLRDLLNQTVRLWQREAREKGLRLRVEGAHGIPGHVRGDPIRLRQVLNNLLSNALKFTSDGSISLRLRCWPEEPGGHALLIDVRDTGPGMTPTQLERLFTPFDQTGEGVSARYGGTGLGLAISRDLIELMGGRLTARSVLGAGSTFTVAIRLEASRTARPVVAEAPDAGRDAVARALHGRATAVESHRPIQSEPATPPVAAPPAEPEPGPDDDGAPPLRVLVVDDHDINRRAVQLILAAVDCEIAMAADGLAALAACEQSAFDVIFMDVRMPELDGRETTRRLRAGAGPNVATPVIAVTADTAPEDIAACMAAGMTYFVSKPLTPGSLLGALSHVLSGDADPADGDATAAA